MKRDSTRSADLDRIEEWDDTNVSRTFIERENFLAPSMDGRNVGEDINIA